MMLVTSRIHGRITVAVSAILASTLGLVSLAGCGGSDNAVPKDANGKPVVKITLVKQNGRIPITEMKWPKKLEEACDCTIKWDEPSGNSWGQQKNVALSAGDISDLTLWGYDRSQYSQFPDLFEDLSDDLDKMPNVQEYFKEDPTAKKFGTDIESGAIFQIPSDVTNRYKAWTGGQMMMINKSWLDKLGLKVPTTWDEFTNVLEAFKTQDPNGNGKQDEVPFLLRKVETSIFGWWNPYLLLNSTGMATQFFSPSQQGLYIKDGKIGNFMLTDNFRQVTEYLHDLVSRGLIPTESLTMDSSKYTGLVQGEGSTARVGVTFGWNTHDPFGDALSDQYVAMNAPLAPGATKVTWEPGTNDIYNGAFVKKDSPVKEQVLKIINAWLDPTITIDSYIGDIPTYVTDDGNNTYTRKAEVNDHPGTYYTAEQYGLTWIRPGTTIKGITDLDLVGEDASVYDDTKVSLDDVKNYIPSYVSLSSADQNTVSNNNTQIMDYAVPTFSGWITKGGLTDESWKTFTDSVRKLGAEENVKLWQKWYDKYTAE